MSENTLPPISLDESYTLCRKIAREKFSEFSWTIGNLPKDQCRHIYAIMAFLAKAMELQDINVSPVARRKEWQEWSESVRDAFRDRETEPELVALVDTIEQFEISREYLFDVLAGVDLALRCKNFEAFDQWLQLGSRIGGSIMLSAMPVLGFEEKGYEEAALACGEAIYLTQLIDEMGTGFHKVMHYAPRVDARKYGVNLEAINPKEPGKEFNRFIRRLVSRIEPLFEEGGKLIPYLSFDGKRVMRTLISIHWTLLMKMKVDPEGVLQNAHQLTKKDLLKFRFKHLMGWEGGVPYLEEASKGSH